MITLKVVASPRGNCFLWERPTASGRQPHFTFETLYVPRVAKGETITVRNAAGKIVTEGTIGDGIIVDLFENGSPRSGYEAHRFTPGMVIEIYAVPSKREFLLSERKQRYEHNYVLGLMGLRGN